MHRESEVREHAFQMVRVEGVASGENAREEHGDPISQLHPAISLDGGQGSIFQLEVKIPNGGWKRSARADRGAAANKY